MTIFKPRCPGVYIAGELGGMALIRIATEQGTQAIDAIAFEMGVRSRSDELVDVLIVGSGPAGLAASLRASELGMSYRTIDRDDVGGTVRKYPRRKLTLTGRLNLPRYGDVKKQEFVKEELIEFWESLIDEYDLNMESGVKLLRLSGEKDNFTANTSAGPIRARRVILALGRRGTPRKLGVPGEELDKVQYQLTDAHTYNNAQILVVGGGDSAIEAAMAFANQTGNSVTLSYRRKNFFRLKARNEERIDRYRNKIRIVFESEVKEIDPHFVTLSTEGEGESITRIKNDYVFIFAGWRTSVSLPQRHGHRIRRSGRSSGCRGHVSRASLVARRAGRIGLVGEHGDGRGRNQGSRAGTG